MEWCQYVGYEDSVAGALVATGMAGVVVGCFIGGAVSDWACEKSPAHGRVYVAQVAAFLSISFFACAILLLQRPDQFGPLATLLFLHGVFRDVPYVGCVRPMLSELALPSRRQSGIYAPRWGARLVSENFEPLVLARIEADVCK